MAQRRAPTRAPRSSGFTLVELLVVIGIIALLIGILMPILSRAQESARRVACLSNTSQLTRAALLYLSDNREILPDGCNANALESPLSPRAVGLPAGAAIGPDTHVLPTIAHLLQSYLGGDHSAWRCPSAPSGSFSRKGDNPLSGAAPTDEFRPNYSFMATKDLFFLLPNADPATVSKYRLKDWAVRNVSGLRIQQLRRAERISTSRIVLFYDRTPNYHATRGPDIYSGAYGDYWASYGYLDGHAEGKGYHNVNEYLKVFHPPIPQSWFGADFAARFDAQYHDAY